MIAAPGLAQLGFAKRIPPGASSGGQGVGDVMRSWAYDGSRRTRFVSGSTKTCGNRVWRSGDVVAAIVTFPPRGAYVDGYAEQWSCVRGLA